MRNALETLRRQTKESVGVLSDLSDRNLMKLGIGFTYVMNGMSDVASSPLVLLIVSLCRTLGIALTCCTRGLCLFVCGDIFYSEPNKSKSCRCPTRSMGAGGCRHPLLLCVNFRTCNALVHLQISM